MTKEIKSPPLEYSYKLHLVVRFLSPGFLDEVDGNSEAPAASLGVQLLVCSGRNLSHVPPFLTAEVGVPCFPL